MCGRGTGASARGMKKKKRRAIATERVERAYLEQVLERYKGRIDRCADHCGLSRRSISEKLRRYGIDKAEFKKGARVGSEAGSAAL